MSEKTAVIHDWLNGMRGGEKVLEEILKIFPEADIFTLFLESKKISETIRQHRILTSSLNRFSWVRRHYPFFIPLFPGSVEEFNLQDYRLVLSSSHCVAKGVIPAPDATHIGYIHSPMRYAWDQYYPYFGRYHGIRRGFIRRQMSRLRTWDVASSARVDHFIANSDYVRKRIEKFYRREATVIHPPVDTDFFQPAVRPSRDYYLLVSALVPYKRVGVLVDAFNRIGSRLVIVGRGTEEGNLRRQAGKNIEFTGSVTPDRLRELYQNARALVFCGVEDFGIFFGEALACGTPLVAYGRGGVRDIGEEGKSAIFFAQQTPESLIDALKIFEKSDFDTDEIRRGSLRFSPDHFRRKFRTFVEERVR